MRHLYCTRKRRRKLSGAHLSNNRGSKQNIYVLNRPLNPNSDNEPPWRFLGREFQAEGAEKQTQWFPNRFDRVREMKIIPEAEERKEARDGSAERREILVERYLWSEDTFTWICVYPGSYFK